jgi:hypothetical protein
MLESDQFRHMPMRPLWPPIQNEEEKLLLFEAVYMDAAAIASKPH